MLLKVGASHAAKVAGRRVLQKVAISIQPARFSQLIIIEEKNVSAIRVEQCGIARGRDAWRRLTPDTNGWRYAPSAQQRFVEFHQLTHCPR